MPTMTSAAKRMTAADRRPPYSLVYTAARTPTGTAMTVARPTSWSEPRIEATAPPPTPSAFGGLVSRSRLRAAAPLTTTNAMTAISGMMPTIAATRHRPRKNRSTRARRASVRDRRSERGRVVAATVTPQPPLAAPTPSPATRRMSSAGEDVEDDRHAQQGQAEGDEARGLEPDRGLAERRRDLRRDGLSLAEEARTGSAALLPMTIVTAIVSPRARPRPRMIAPRSPTGHTAGPPASMVSQRVAPSASMRLALVVRDRVDDLAGDRDTIVGSDHDRQDDPGREDPDPEARTGEEGDHLPIEFASQSSTVARRNGLSTKTPHRPITTLGMAARSSTEEAERGRPASAGRQLGQEDRRQQADGDGDDHSR